MSSPPSHESITAALPLPKTSGLQPDQVRGGACVWCKDPLTNDTAVDLGARSGTFQGVVSRWFPRGCEPCVSATARRVLRIHVRTCDRCSRDATTCGTRRALRRLALEVRR
ncbi:hypothetical protein ABZU45_00810 [Streptomyces avermitilis]|uniref:hypothetical protein n=1 Tax=Streptomyces avermitilis TaxID=33903 RepID=UPI0033B8A5AF